MTPSDPRLSVVEGTRPESVAAPVSTLLLSGEVALLVMACAAVFFVGLGRHDFIKTEGLRAIVVAEMLESPARLAMPTVHHRPYTKKPPLYAWCTAALARTVRRFDEQIARLPSAVAGTLLMLLLYLVGEGAFGRGAGLAAATLALANVTVVDYSTRAELDMGFALLTTAGILLAYPPLRRGGATAVVCWMGCYLLVTLAALWKAPHSLFFLWATLLAYGWRKRHWPWLWHPAQIAGLLLTLAVLGAWAWTLSNFAGDRTVAQTAAIELVNRLVPLSAGDWLSIVYAVPMMVVIALPASLFVLASLGSGVVYEADPNGHWQPEGRSVRSVARFCAGRFRLWWQALAVSPFAEFLLYWTFANLAWCAVVPAKAPRYWLPMFAPVFLLAGRLLGRQLARPVSAAGQRHVDVTWRWVYGVIGAVGIAGLLVTVALLVSGGNSVGGWSLGPAWAWLALGTGWTTIAVICLIGRSASPTPGRCLGLLVVILAAKPVVAQAWWPVRERSTTQRPNAAAIDERVPPGSPVLVLGRHELPDLEFYSRRRFDWLDSPAEAAWYTSSSAAYFLLRSEDLEECVASQGFTYDLELEFDRADRPISLIRIDSIPRPGRPAQADESVRPAAGSPAPRG